MATLTHTSLLEYLHSSYRPDREFIDGELLERSAGNWEHARIQALLTSWFGSQEKAWSVKVATEQRMQVSPTRVRIPDVVLVPRGPQPEVIVEAPILVVEILSPDDTYTDTQLRAADYLNMGGGPSGSSTPHREPVGSAWVPPGLPQRPSRFQPPPSGSTWRSSSPISKRIKAHCVPIRLGRALSSWACDCGAAEILPPVESSGRQSSLY